MDQHICVVLRQGAVDLAFDILAYQYLETSQTSFCLQVKNYQSFWLQEEA